MSSTFYAKNPAMPRRGSSHISAQDLMKLNKSKGKSGVLREKKTTKIMRSIKWRYKYVILAHNAIYIYENEMSKQPDTSIPLLGYTAVEREKNSTCPWVFALVPGVSSLSRRSFACSNEEERKEWMHEIKEHLYTANNVKNTSLSVELREKLKLAENLTPEEKMYLELECPVLRLEEMSSKDDKALKIVEAEDSSDDEDEEEENEEVLSKNVLSGSGVKMRQGNYLKIDRTDEQQVADEDDPLVRALGRSWAGGREDRSQQDEAGPLPPRYSAIVGGKELVYQNIPADTAKAKESGLERACTITEESLSRDRDKCVEMLKKTNKIGTYLIRKSRTQDYKVLSVLGSDYSVKEYRIDTAYGLFHFFHDTSHEFPSIESLLAYYSHHKPVPSLGTFLGWGIHECDTGDNQTYSETF